jgi:serine/threonine protein kinase/tetratricopeptide (TPR) repeat protein
LSGASPGDRWSRIQEIFHATLQRPPSERAEFLTRACAGDEQLRAEVASLIDAHEGDGVVAELETDRAPRSDAAQRIGAYRFIRRIGEGGMGSVFLAERQGSGFTQMVALKLIPGGANNPHLEDRLREERRILARLEHPGIARFVDGAATDSGQAYYAMEYVEGTSLLSYCDEQRLTIRDRLQLFIEMCDAVHYAHTQLVVHRDLKPGNILVTRDGRPKLLDFGIAKLLDEGQGSPDATLTAPWFTPAYASPEQVRGGQVGTLSDVYALGVLLYELLTGKRPYEFPSLAPADVVDVVCNRQPPRPSTRVASDRLRRRLSGDLDTIVLKAQAKEPTRRYNSVEQFANDLRRYLQGKPVMARTDSVGYRASKFVRRNRVAVLAVTVVIVSLVGGVVVASREAAAASRSSQRAEAALLRSEGVAEFVIDLLSTEDASMDPASIRAVLDRGLSQAEELSAQPEVQAQTFDALAHARYNLADYQEAARLFTRAYEIRHALYPDGHPDVARSLTRLSDAVGRLGLADSTRALLAAAWAMEQSLGPVAQRAQLETLVQLGRVARGDREYAASDSLLRLALALGERIAQADDPLVLDAMHQLAMTRRLNGELAGADSLFSELIAIKRRSLGPDHPSVAATMFFLGDLLVDQGDSERAEALFRDGLRIAEHSLGTESVRLVHGINSLAGLLAGAGRYDEAVALVERGVRISRAAYGADNIATARERETLAGILLRAGRLDEAERLFLELLEQKRALIGAWTVPSVLVALSEIAVQRGDLERAERYAAEALAIERESDSAPLTIAQALRRLAAVQQARGASSAAEASLIEAANLEWSQRKSSRPAGNRR